MSQQYDLAVQLQFVTLSQEYRKNWFLIFFFIFLLPPIDSFCDVMDIKVRYFEITFKVQSISPKLQDLETLFFQQKIEKVIKREKIFLTKNLKVWYF